MAALPAIVESARKTPNSAPLARCLRTSESDAFFVIGALIPANGATVAGFLTSRTDWRQLADRTKFVVGGGAPFCRYTSSFGPEKAVTG